MAEDRVVFVLPTLVGGGAESVVVGIADGLPPRPPDVEVVSLLDAKARSGTWPSGLVITALGAARVRSSALALVRHLRARRPQAVLTTLKHVSAALALLRWVLPRHRHVARVANTYSQELASLSPRRRAFELRLLRVSHRRIDHFICVSAGVRDDLRVVAGVEDARCTVIMNPVDVDRLKDRARETLSVELKPEVTDAAVRFLAVGRLEPQKDHRTLLTAFAALPASLGAALVVVGSGSLADVLHEEARQLGVTDRVQFTGFLANPYPIFERCDALVLSSRFEGMPNVLLEALALGLRCVSTDCPSGPSEILTDESLGLLVPVGDPRALAAAMERVIRLPHDPLAGPRRVRMAHSPSAVSTRYREVLIGDG